MTTNFSAHLKPVLGFFAVAAISGCSSDLTGGNTHPVQLSFTTHVVEASNVLASDQAVDPAGDLVLQKVQLVFGKLELDRTGSADCVAEAEAADDDHEQMGQECEDVSRTPFIVDVPADATLHPLINVPLAAGTYSELEAKLEPARDRFTDFNAAHPDLVGKSVRVEGTFKGAPFVFSAPVRAEVGMEFDPPLVVDETTKNATVSLDVSKWFLDASGNVIDPASATPDSEALQQIERNIRQSFHAFEDDSERGEDHHEGHDGNDDGTHD
jgi:hypothetical protein